MKEHDFTITCHACSQIFPSGIMNQVKHVKICTGKENKNDLISVVHNESNLPGMKRFPDKYFDWAICDIEYEIGASKPSKKPHRAKQKNGEYLSIKESNYEHSDWDFQKSPPEYFEELFRVSKNQIIFGGNYYGLAGGYLVWDKLNGNSDQFGCEMAWLSFTKRTDIVYYMWAGMMQGEVCSRDIRKSYKQQGNKKLNEARIHETQKPIKLYDFILNEYVEKGSKVIDTHVGSGSNRIANYLYGNEFHGFEISKSKFDKQEKWFAESKKRQEELNRQIKWN